MEEIAVTAERRGLINSVTIPRRDDPTVFVMDLWTHSPATEDRLNLARHQIQIDPLKVNDLSSAVDVIP